MDVNRVVEKFRAIRETGIAQVERAKVAHPEIPNKTWIRIMCVWDDFHEHFGYEVQPDEVETKLIEALVLISSGVGDPRKLGLPKAVGRRLLECYNQFGR